MKILPLLFFMIFQIACEELPPIAVVQIFPQDTIVTDMSKPTPRLTRAIGNTWYDSKLNCSCEFRNGFCKPIQFLNPDAIPMDDTCEDILEIVRPWFEYSKLVGTGCGYRDNEYYTWTELEFINIHQKDLCRQVVTPRGLQKIKELDLAIEGDI